MITIRVRVLGLEVAQIVLEGRDDIDDEFEALAAEQADERTGE